VNSGRRILTIIVAGAAITIAGGWSGHYLYQERKAYVKKKKKSENKSL
jgi:hypothetical protein